MMAPSLQALGIDRMSVEEQIALATAIWDRTACRSHSKELGRNALLCLSRRKASPEARP
jgi:hypothetical protein